MPAWIEREAPNTPFQPGRGMAGNAAVLGSVLLHGVAVAALFGVFSTTEPPRVAAVVPVSLVALPLGGGTSSDAPALPDATLVADPAPVAESTLEESTITESTVERAEPVALAPTPHGPQPILDTPVFDTPAVDTAVAETPVVESKIADAPAAEPAETQAVAAAAADVGPETVDVAIAEEVAAQEPPPQQHAQMPVPPPEPSVSAAMPTASAQPVPPPTPPPQVTRPVSPPSPAAARPVARAAPRPASARPALARPASPAAPGAASPDATVPGAPPAGMGADDAPLVLTSARFRHPPTPPRYPPRARDLGLEGEVVVRCLLDRTGTPSSVTLTRSSGHPMLDQAAIVAVRGWAFEPGRRGGVTVPAIVQIPVRFALR